MLRISLTLDSQCFRSDEIPNMPIFQVWKLAVKTKLLDFLNFAVNGAKFIEQCDGELYLTMLLIFSFLLYKIVVLNIWA